MIRNTWHGYPIDADQNMYRPWWRTLENRVHGAFAMRCDGVTAWCGISDSGPGTMDYGHGYRQKLGSLNTMVPDLDFIIQAIDEKLPMPRPPILVGQVWSGPRGAVLLTNAEVADITRPTMAPVLSAVYKTCLVWGPFAPWQDTTPKEEKT